MIDYRNSKTSIHIEEQLPFPAKASGDAFMNFLKTYYDYLERRIVIIEGKADFTVTKEDILNGSFLSGDNILIGTEDTPSLVIVDERVNYDNILENIHSLQLDGLSTYVDVDHSIITLEEDWSLSLFLKLTEYPSVLRSDFDIITLSNTDYLSILKITKDSNQICYNLGQGDVSTGIDIRKGEWYFITIRYTSNNIFYDVFNITSQYSYEAPVTFTTTSNRFVVGCDLYQGGNFSYAIVDEIGVWNKFLSDAEIVAIYNDGNPIDLGYTTILNPNSYESEEGEVFEIEDGYSSIEPEYYIVSDYISSQYLTDYFRFEEENTTALNSVKANNNGTIYGDYFFSVDVPTNLRAFCLENDTSSLYLKILSYTIYDNVDTNSMLNRVLLFCEYYYGSLVKDAVILNTDKGPISIGNYREVKNPLYTINNLSNFQEVDYVCNYDNYISNDFFQYFWKEFTTGMPMNLAYVHETSIKDIIAKSITEFYRTKGTLDSFRHFFKILYNEDLSSGYISSTSTGSFDNIIDTFENDQVFEYDKVVEIGEDIYANDTFEYTIKTRFYASEEVKTYIKKLCHPVGFKMNLVAPS